MSPEYIADVLPYLRKLARKAKVAERYERQTVPTGYNDFRIVTPGGDWLSRPAHVDAEILRLQNIAAVKRVGMR